MACTVLLAVSILFNSLLAAALVLLASPHVENVGTILGPAMRPPAPGVVAVQPYAGDAFSLVRRRRYSEVVRRSRSQDERGFRRCCAKLCGVWPTKGRQGNRSAGRTAHRGTAPPAGSVWTRPALRITRQRLWIAQRPNTALAPSNDVKYNYLSVFSVLNFSKRSMLSINGCLRCSSSKTVFESEIVIICLGTSFPVSFIHCKIGILLASSASRMAL